MDKTVTRCIGGMEHKWEYHKTEEGNSYYVCWCCGDVSWVTDEHNGG